MKRITIAATALSLTLLCGGPLLAQSGNDLYQQALVKERAEGDVQGAIELYQRIAREFAADRPLAAKALVQMGLCYEKLGQQGAQDAYAQVIEEYADQTEEAALARDRLSAMERPPEESEGVFITARQLWADVHSNAEAPTPDGQSLVWVDWQGSMDLAVRGIATGENRMLTRHASMVPPGAYTYSGRISPNGETVAYGLNVGREYAGLHVIGMNGANSRELYRETGCWVYPQAWTSDGNFLVAKRDCWSAVSPEGVFETLLFSVSDGSSRVLMELSDRAHGDPASLSPDDRYLVYSYPVEEEGGNADIWILSLDGSIDGPLVQHPANDQLLGWIPGTSQVLFLSDRDGTQDLWAATVEGGLTRGSPRMVQRNMGQINPAGFSDDGSFFYTTFTRWYSTSLAPFDVSSAAVGEGSAKALLGSNRDVAWSPDSERLAFVNEPENLLSKDGELHIRHLSSGEEHVLAPDLKVRRVRGWSPEGGSILVAGWEESPVGEKGGLYTVNVEDGEATQVLDYPPEARWPQGVQATWSADGQAIIYSVTDYTGAKEGRLVWRDLSSGEERELLRDSFLDWPGALALSPSGSHLAYGIEEMSEDSPAFPERVFLMTLDLESGSTRQLAELEGPMTLGSLQWTPDGQYLLFGQSEKGEEWQTHVSRVPVSGGTPEHLWTLGEGDWGAWFSLSPDGQRIAYTIFTQETEVWVMENLREVLRDKEGGK